MERRGIDPEDPSVTRALLMAGWGFEELRLTAEDFARLRTELAAIAVGARVIPQGTFAPDATGPVSATFVVGVVGPADRANDPEPTGPLPLRDLRALVEAAKQLPDAVRERAAELLGAASASAPAVLENPPALILVPTGPFAHGRLTYGVRVERGETGSLELPAHFGHGIVSAEGEELLPSQTPHAIGVAGVEVAAGGSVMEPLRTVDPSDDAHREREDAVDEWPGKPGYYLTASCDG